jgi:hypothetical protein
LFSVELATCKHSRHSAVDCRLCETDKDRKQRLARRIKREETRVQEVQHRHLEAQKRKDAERDAISSSLLVSRVRNRNLGGLKHRIW